MNEDNQSWFFNHLQLEQILLILESLESDIDQESLICILNENNIRLLYNHNKEKQNLLYLIPKMFMGQV